MKEEVKEDEGDPLNAIDPSNGNDEEAQVGEAKPYKPLEIDSLQIIHISRYGKRTTTSYPFSLVFISSPAS